MFEREYGTLADVLNCVEKTKNIIKDQSDTQVLKSESSDMVTGNHNRIDRRQKKRRYEEEEQKTDYRFKKGKFLKTHIIDNLIFAYNINTV